MHIYAYVCMYVLYINYHIFKTSIYLAEEKGDSLCHSVTDKFSSMLRNYIESQVISKLDTTHKEQNKRLENLEDKLNAQTSKIDKFGETQIQILQQINDKLNKHQEILQMYERELLNRIKSRPKLSKQLLLGLSTSNLTSINY